MDQMETQMIDESEISPLDLEDVSWPILYTSLFVGGDGTLQRFPYYVVVKVSNILYEEPMRHQRYGCKYSHLPW